MPVLNLIRLKPPKSCMPLDKIIVSRLRDVLAHAADAISYVNDVSLDQFKNDQMRYQAAIRCLEVIGEAAAALRRYCDKTDFTLADISNEIPWPMMISMRNLLLHEYGRVDLDIVYSTIKNDLPALHELVDALLS